MADNLFCGDPVSWRRHKLEVLLGKTGFGGLDVGVVNDFTCLAAYFPHQKDVPKPVLMLWAWVPEDVEYHKLLKERYGYHDWVRDGFLDRKSTRLNSSHLGISYAVF